MANETTYAGKLGDLQRLLEPLAANAAELAHLEGSRAKLADLLTQAITINKQQAAFRAAKQEQSVQLKTLLSDSQRLASLLRAALKEHYGIRSEKLVEFGIQPFRGRNRKPKPEAPAGAGNPDSGSPTVVESQLADRSNS